MQKVHCLPDVGIQPPAPVPEYWLRLIYTQAHIFNTTVDRQNDNKRSICLFRLQDAVSCYFNKYYGLSESLESELHQLLEPK